MKTPAERRSFMREEVRTTPRGWSTTARPVVGGLAVLAFALLASFHSVPARAEDTLWTRSLGVEEGLSQNYVLAIAQDRAGFLWFGTVSGLNRWDGYTFESFAHLPDDPASLSAPTILALHADQRGNLWVGTTVGLDRFDPAANTFERYGHLIGGRRASDPVPIEGITSDRAGRVWFASLADGALHRLDPQTGRVREFRVPGASGQWVSALLIDSADRLWVAMQPGQDAPADGRGQLLVFDQCSEIGEDGLPAPREPVSLPVGGGKVSAIVEDHARRLWVASSGGALLRYDPRSGVVAQAVGDSTDRRAFVRGDVRSLAVGPAGEVWALARVPGSGEGVALFRVEAQTLAARRVSLREQVVRPDSGARLERLAVDRTGVLWLTANAGGVHYVDVSAGGFSLHRGAVLGGPGLNGSFVRAVIKRRDGSVWVGGPRGLTRIDRSGSEVRYSHPSATGGVALPDPDVRALHEDRDGNLWIATRGLAVIERSTGTVRHYRHDPGDPRSLSEDQIQVIHEDHEGRLWLGTLRTGLSEFDPRSRSFTHHPGRPDDGAALPSGRVTALFSDTRRQLWVGTAAGLARMDVSGGAARRLEPVAPGTAGLGGAAILSIAQSGLTPDVLWVGTEQRGLCRLDLRDQSVRFFTTRNSGLADNTIYGILSDRRGRLWMSTNRGLVCFDPAADSFRTYGPERGLQSREFNAFAFFQAPDGELFFGGVGGLSAFYPNRIADNPHPPAVLVTAVRALDRDARLPQSPAIHVYRHGMPPQPVRIGYGLRDVTIDFVALHYSDAGRNRCLYKLDDYDRDWQDPAGQRSARYTNLDPGTYTFRVKALSGHGVPSNGEATFTGRHGSIPPDALAIENANRQLEMVDQLLALARLDAGQPEFRPRDGRLDECVRHAAAPFESLARRQRTRWQVDLPDEGVRGVFDEQKIEQVIGNLLGNALKFTPAGGAVTLRLRTATDGWATIDVEDTGPGIPTHDLPHVFERFYRGDRAGGHTQGTGIGLALAKEYVDLHGGEIRAEGRPGGGTHVIVRLPVSAPADGAVVRDAREREAQGDGPVAAASDASASPLAVVPAADDAAGVGRARVLVVEDHGDMRAYLRKHLAPHYEVLEAARGDVALAQIDVEMPDVVVSDVMMPGLDGYALCRAVKANPDTDFIPVILLTARAGGTSRLDGLEGGADDYVTKPFEPAELLARIRNLLLARERLRARYATRTRGVEIEPTPLPLPSADAAFVKRLQEVLDRESHEESFDVSVLATRLGVSRAQLHRRVKDVLRSTPAETIIRFRLERAARMLADRAGNVGEVAYAVGFKNLSHFVRRFREQYGQTPAAYAAGRQGRPGDGRLGEGRGPSATI